MADAAETVIVLEEENPVMGEPSGEIFASAMDEKALMLAAEFTVLEEALGDWVSLIPSGQTLLPGSADEMFDLAVAPGAIGFSAAGIEDTADLVDRLRAMGVTIEGIEGGFSDAEGTIPETAEGILLAGSGTFELFTNRALAEGFAGLGLNNSLAGLARGLGEEVSLEADSGWKASLVLHLVFQLDSEGHLEVREGTRLDLSIKTDEVALSGSLGGGALTLSEGGRLEAEYQLSMALREESTETTLETLVTTAETHFATSTTGSAQVLLNGTAGAASWILSQTLETVVGEDGIGSTVVIEDSMRLFLPLPGMEFPVELTGHFDEGEGTWLLVAENLQYGEMGEVTVYATLSKDGLEGAIMGEIEAPFLIGAEGEALRTEVTLAFDAEKILGWEETEKRDFSLRRGDGEVLFSLPETLFTWRSSETLLTAERLEIGLDWVSHEGDFAGLPEGTDLRLRGNESRAALEGNWTLGADTVAVTAGEVQGSVAEGLSLSGFMRTLAIDLSATENFLLEIGGVNLVVEAVVSAHAATILAGTLRWNRDRLIFDAEETVLTAPVEFDEALRLLEARLGTEALEFTAEDGWTGAVVVKAPLGYVWYETGGTVGRLSDSSGNGIAFQGRMDVGSASTTWEVDGLNVSQGRRLQIDVPAFAVSYDWADGVPDAWATVDAVQVSTRAFGPTVQGTVDGVEVDRYFLLLPEFSFGYAGEVTTGGMVVLENPTLSAPEGLRIHHPESGSGLRGSLVLSATEADFAPGQNTNDRLSMGGAEAVFVFSPSAGASSLRTEAKGVSYEQDDGVVVTFDSLALVGGEMLFEAQDIRGTLAGGTSAFFSQFAVTTGGVVTIVGGEVLELDAEEVLLADGFLPFKIVRAVAVEGSPGLYSASGYLDFASIGGRLGGLVEVSIGGEVYQRADQLVTLILRQDAEGLRPENTGEIVVTITNRSVGTLAMLNLELPLGSYVDGEYQAPTISGEAEFRFRSIFQNGPGGAWTAPLNLIDDGDGARSGTASWTIDLETFQFAATGVEITLELLLNRRAGGGFDLVIESLGNTTGVNLVASPVGGVELRFVDAIFDFTATGGQALVTPDRVEASVSLDSIGLLGLASGLVIGANGMLSAPGKLKIALGGVDEGGILDAMRWPTWLPIQVETFVLQWRNFNADWTDFVAVLSGQARVDFGETKSTNFAGAITGLTLDFKRLLDGEFPFIGIDEVALEVSGFVLGLNAQGRAILGMLKLDANGDVIPTTDLDTEVAETVLYAAVDVEVTIKGIGLRLYFGLSEYGPLSFYFSAGVPLPVGGKTGFVLGGLRGGIQLFSETEAVTDPRDLASGNLPQVTPLAQQNFYVWRAGFHNQLANQVATVNSPTFLLDFVTAPFRIEGGATFYNIKATKSAFSVDVDVILDSSGRLTLAGRFQAFSVNPAAKTSKGLSDIKAWFHMDIADAADGEVTILANIRKEGVFGKLALNLYGMLDIDLGAEFDEDNPPEALLENIKLRFLGGVSLSVSVLPLARFEGIVEWGADLSSSRMYLAATGDLYILGIEELFGPINAGAGRLEIFFDENDEVQMQGAVEIGNILNFDLGEVGGFTLGGQAVLRVNTTNEATRFEIPSLTSGEGETIREVDLAPLTGDLFVEGGLGLRAAGYEFLRLNGQMGVGIEEDGLRVFAVGDTVLNSVGEVNQVQGLAEAFFRLETTGITPSVAGTVRFRDGKVALAQGIDLVNGGQGLMQLRGDLDLGVNTTGREIVVTVPTEKEEVFGAREIDLPAGLILPDGTESAAGPWLRLAGQGSMDLLGVLWANGNFYLGTNLEEGSFLEFNGEAAVRLFDDELMRFDAEGRFRMDEKGLYGYAAQTVEGGAVLTLPGGQVPIQFSGDLGLAINSTNEEQVLDGRVIEAGRYARIQHDGTLRIGDLTFTGTQSLEAMEGGGVALLVDGLVEARIGNETLFGVVGTGALRILNDGIYGTLEISSGAETGVLDGLPIRMIGTGAVTINTTMTERDGIGANLGGRIALSGSVFIGENARISGSHVLTSGNDQITWEVDGEAVLEVENELEERVDLLRLPLARTFVFDTPVLQETISLSLPEEHALFTELGFGVGASVALEINTSTVATEEIPAGPYWRLQVEGTLEHSGQSLEGMFYLYQDVRTIRAEAAVDFTLRAEGNEFFRLEGDLALQIGFAGIGGSGRVVLEELEQGGNWGNLADFELELSFNSSPDTFLIPRAGEDDLLLAAGPYFNLTTSGQWKVDGVVISGDFALAVDRDELRADLEGSVRMDFPNTDTVVLELGASGALRLNGKGLYGQVDLTGDLSLPSFMELDLAPEVASSARFVVNTTGEEQELTEELTLEGGNYARLEIEGRISGHFIRMDGEFALEVEGDDLLLRVRADSGLYIPEAGPVAETQLVNYSVNGLLSIKENGVVGALSIGEVINAPELNVLESFEFDFNLLDQEASFIINTTDEEVTIEGIEFEAGRYGRLRLEGVINLGGFGFEGIHVYQVGALGVDVQIDSNWNIRIPAFGGNEAIPLATLRVDGGLLITSNGVAGYLQQTQVLGVEDTSFLGFTIPFNEQISRFEINFTGEEVEFGGLTLEAGKYAQLVNDGILSVELGPFSAGYDAGDHGGTRIRTGDNMLRLFGESDMFIALPAEEEGGEEVRIFSSLAELDVRLTSDGLSGVYALREAVDLSALKRFGLNIPDVDPNLDAFQEFFYFVNTTKEEVELPFGDGTVLLSADDFFGMRGVGELNIGLDADTPLVTSVGEYKLTLSVDGLELQTFSGAGLLGQTVFLTGALGISPEGLWGILEVSHEQINLGDVFTLDGRLEIGINTSDTDRTFVLGAGTSVERSRLLEGESFRLFVDEADLRLGGFTLISGSLVFEKDAETGWRAEVGAGDEPFTIQPIPGVTATATGFLAEDGTHSLVGQVESAIGVPSLAKISGMIDFTLAKLTPQSPVTSLITINGEATILGATAAVVDGTIVRDGNDWSVFFATDGLSLDGLNFDGQVEIRYAGDQFVLARLVGDLELGGFTVTGDHRLEVVDGETVVSLDGQFALGDPSEVALSGTLVGSMKEGLITGSMTGSLSTVAGTEVISNLGFIARPGEFFQLEATPLQVSLGGLATSANLVYRYENRGGDDYHLFALPGAPGATALDFQGNATIVLSSEISPVGGYTVETWVRLDATGGDQAILAATGSNSGLSDYLHLVVRDGRLLQGHFSDDLVGSTILQTGQWYHVAFTYNAETLERAMYLNGVLEASDTAARALTNNNNGPLALGQFFAARFNGQMDNFRLWDSALGGELIAQNASLVLPASTPGVVQALAFDEGEGTKLFHSLTGGGSSSIDIQGNALWQIDPGAVGGTSVQVPGLGTISGSGYLDSEGNYRLQGLASLNGLGLTATGRILALSGNDYLFSGTADIDLGVSGQVRLFGEAQVRLSGGIFGSTQEATFTGAIEVLGETVSQSDLSLFGIEDGFVAFTATDFALAGASFSGGAYLTYTNGGTERLVLSSTRPAGVEDLGEGGWNVTLPQFVEANATGSLTLERVGAGWTLEADLAVSANVALGDPSQVALTGAAEFSLLDGLWSGQMTGSLETTAGAQQLDGIAFQMRPGEFFQLEATPLQVNLGGVAVNATLVYRYENRDGQDYHLFALPMQPGETALNFQSSATINLPSSLSLVNGYTVETWIYLDSTAGDQAILSRTGGGAGTSNYLHLIVRGGQAHIGHFGDDLTGQTVLATGQWHHLAFTYDATTLERRIYVNGELDGADTAARKLTEVNNGALQIGSFFGNRLAGQLDNFRIWEAPLAGIDLARQSNLILPGNQPGLRVNLPFDEGSGTVVRSVGGGVPALNVAGTSGWTLGTGTGTANFNLPGLGSISGSGFVDSNGQLYISGAVTLDTFVGTATGRVLASSANDFTFRGTALMNLGVAGAVQVNGSAEVVVQRGSFGNVATAKLNGSVVILGSTVNQGMIDLVETPDGFTLFTGAGFQLGGFSVGGSVYLRYEQGAEERFTLSTTAPAGVAKLGDGALSVQLGPIGQAALTGSLIFTKVNGQWVQSANLTGSVQVNFSQGNNGLNANFNLNYVGGNEQHFAATYSGNLTLLGWGNSIGGTTVIQAGQNTFNFSTTATAGFRDAILSGNYTVELGSNYLRATASGATLNLPGLSNSSINATIDTRGTVRASGNIDISVGNRDLAQIFGTMVFSADQNGASANFYYTAFAAGQEVRSAPFGQQVQFSNGSISFSISQNRSFFGLGLFGFNVGVDQMTFSLGSNGLYVSVSGGASYNRTGGGSMSGFIDLTGATPRYAFIGNFGISASVPLASASGNLRIEMRSPEGNEDGHFVGAFRFNLSGRATGTGSAFGQTVNVSAGLDISWSRVTFNVLGQTVRINL